MWVYFTVEEIIHWGFSTGSKRSPLYKACEAGFKMIDTSEGIDPVDSRENRAEKKRQKEALKSNNHCNPEISGVCGDYPRIKEVRISR